MAGLGRNLQLLICSQLVWNQVDLLVRAVPEMNLRRGWGENYGFGGVCKTSDGNKWSEKSVKKS